MSKSPLKNRYQLLIADVFNCAPTPYGLLGYEPRRTGTSIRKYKTPTAEEMQESELKGSCPTLVEPLEGVKGSDVEEFIDLFESAPLSVVSLEEVTSHLSSLESSVNAVKGAFEKFVTSNETHPYLKEKLKDVCPELFEIFEMTSSSNEDSFFIQKPDGSHNIRFKSCPFLLDEPTHEAAMADILLLIIEAIDKPSYFKFPPVIRLDGSNPYNDDFGTIIVKYKNLFEKVGNQSTFIVVVDDQQNGTKFYLVYPSIKCNNDYSDEATINIIFSDDRNEDHLSLIEKAFKSLVLTNYRIPTVGAEAILHKADENESVNVFTSKFDNFVKTDLPFLPVSSDWRRSSSSMLIGVTIAILDHQEKVAKFFLPCLMELRDHMWELRLSNNGAYPDKAKHITNTFFWCTISAALGMGLITVQSESDFVHTVIGECKESLTSFTGDSSYCIIALCFLVYTTCLNHLCLASECLSFDHGSIDRLRHSQWCQKINHHCIRSLHMYEDCVKPAQTGNKKRKRSKQTFTESSEILCSQNFWCKCEFCFIFSSFLFTVM